jgi:hypothetical protein
MNVSPHQQHPTKYPWPGLASRAMVLLGIALIVLIAVVLITNPWSSDDPDPDSSSTRPTNSQRV